MTKVAREVLDDCREALAELQAGPTGTIWRLRWVTCVTLLRAVGHTLNNCDCTIDDAMKAAIESAWGQWLSNKTADPIFWEFVQEDRNLILKQYEFRAGQDVTIHVPTVGSDTPGWVTHTDRMTKGSFKDRLPAEVVSEAINWWNQKLDAIDTDAESRRASSSTTT